MLRAGVIGVGYLGRLHAQKIASFDDVVFAGVCDADRERGQAVAEEFGTFFFENTRKFLREVDAVSIAVPTTAHFRVAREAIRAGVHVLLEKPIAATAVDSMTRTIKFRSRRVFRSTSL